MIEVCTRKSCTGSGYEQGVERNHTNYTNNYYPSPVQINLIPPPLPEIRSEGHCGPLGKRFSSFFDTEGYPVLAQHLLFFESNLLEHEVTAHSEQTHAGFKRRHKHLESGGIMN